MSTLMWIPVPAGRVQNGKPVLSVVMTPQLDSDLATAGMTDWPGVVTAPGVTFRVQTRTAGSQNPDPAEPTATVRTTARSDIWNRFFGSIGVTPFTRPRGYHAPFVTSTLDDEALVRGTYSRAATEFGKPATVETELAAWEGSAAPPAQPVKDERVQRDPVPDFHRAVAMLREHPHVLRLLGLVVDLDLDSLPTSSGGREISVTWDASPVPVRQRWTRYDFDGQLFLPAADENGDVANGVVDLNDPDHWQIINFDVDGGVGRLRGAARTLAADRARREAAGPDADPDRPTPPALPPLRTVGMMVARKGRGARLAAKAAQGMAASTGDLADKVLTAEDLVLGYRVDIRLVTGDTWFSLHRRDATYKVGDLPDIVAEDEEGHIKPHAAVLDEHGLRTDEVVARWDGWSLSVPRPKLDGGGSPRRRTTVEMPYRFSVDYSVVKKSLIELEFGRAYDVRIRVADLAGGGLERDDVDAGGEVGPNTYVRHEPIPAPRLVTPSELMTVTSRKPLEWQVDHDLLGPAGSLERLVIRSDQDGENFSTAQLDADPRYPANRSRRFEAPVTTFALAERHGVLRIADSSGADRASRAFVDGRAGEPDVDLVAAMQLTDPAALGLAVAVLVQPGLIDREEPRNRPWEGTWPDRVAKDLELVAGAPGSTPDVHWITVDDPTSPDGKASPRVEVILPPGCQVDVEVSSSFDVETIGQFALNSFMGFGSPTGQPNAAQNAMAGGRHPLLTPPRRLLLTHAVRKPLAAATGSLGIRRAAAETLATVVPDDDNPVWGLHVASTGSVDVTASWQEWGDFEEPLDRAAAVGSLNLRRGTVRLPELMHDFGDTKHRRVRFGVRANSRFRDCFVDTDETLFFVDGALEVASVPSSARPVPPQVVSVVPAFRWSSPPDPAGIGRTRSGGGLRLELARPWFTTGEGESLAVLVWPGAEADLPTGVREEVTWCNRDPIQATKAPDALATEAQFAGFVQATDVALAPGGPMVRALIYPVFFHEGHWYADVELPGLAAASYAPFVRLAVARFQDASVLHPADLRMSTAVVAEPCQVLPERTLGVELAGGTAKVSLEGLGRLGNRQANRVFASVERRVGEGGDLTSLNAAEPAFPAWTRVGGGTVAGVLGEQLQVPVPGDGGPFRLVVREVEEMASSGTVVGVDAPDELAKRTVFVDVVDLSAP